MRFRIPLLLFLFGIGLFSTSAWAVILNLNVPPILSFEYDGGPFTLPFSSFLEGSRSGTHAVTYRIRANQMNFGMLPAAISVRLGEAFDHVRLEAYVQAYQNLGPSNFATLRESRSGFQTIETVDKPLADKQAGQGEGDPCLDGHLTVIYGAILKDDAPAGTQTRSVIVTLHDGN